MKTRLSSLFAAFAAALLALLAPNAWGQSPTVIGPPSLPVSIPTASTMQGLWDWVVTNQKIGAPVNVAYTDTNGVNRVVGSVGVLTNFPSFQIYLQFIAGNVTRIISEIKTGANPPNPNMPVEIIAPIGYGLQTPYTPMRIDSTAPMLSAITYEWLTSLTPSYINVMVSVPGLQRFTVSVSNANPPYTNSWPIDSNDVTKRSASSYPPERTTTNWLVLNTWYLLQQYHARFTVSVSGQTNTYTQDGAILSPPVVTISDVGHVRVTMALGSDTTVQSTGDFVTWKTLVTYSGYTNVTNQVLTVDTNNPALFFRAYSN
ncbi:MAG: hypothetical protein KGL39_43475 [Patescibacteria group bacterium]|nr:hypothetical protein [Patescibacteria group bacterium]